MKKNKFNLKSILCKINIFMEYKLYNNDLPATLKFNKIVAIDTETMGLKPHRDRLCVIQISNGDGIAHLVQITKNENSKRKNLLKLLKNKSITKLFHYARFDLAVLKKNLCDVEGPIFCTKIASKLCRTFGAKHGLKDLCFDLLGIELNKNQQTSDWGAVKLSKDQLEYASNDVWYLHNIKTELEKVLKREGKDMLAKECFKFLTTRSKLDLVGFEDIDIFSH